MQHRTGRASGQTIYQRLLINNIGVLDLRVNYDCSIYCFLKNYCIRLVFTIAY